MARQTPGVAHTLTVAGFSFVQQANGLIPYVSVSAPYVKGWDVNEVYAPMGWDIANWYIEK